MREEELFEKIKTYLIPDLKKTERYSFEDATSEKYNLNIELKCRSVHYQYLLVEKVKFDKLNLNKRARYICSTPVGIFSFNIKKLPEPKWFEKWLPETTEFGEKKWILKKIGYYSIDSGKNLSNILNF